MSETSFENTLEQTNSDIEEFKNIYFERSKKYPGKYKFKKGTGLKRAEKKEKLKEWKQLLNTRKDLRKKSFYYKRDIDSFSSSHRTKEDQRQVYYWQVYSNKPQGVSNSTWDAIRNYRNTYFERANTDDVNPRYKVKDQYQDQKDGIWEEVDNQLLSINPGIYSTKHMQNLARDISSVKGTSWSTLPKEEKLETIKYYLKKGYKVLDEKNHLHLEYNPEATGLSRFGVKFNLFGKVYTGSNPEKGEDIWTTDDNLYESIKPFLKENFSKEFPQDPQSNNRLLNKWKDIITDTDIFRDGFSPDKVVYKKGEKNAKVQKFDDKKNVDKEVEGKQGKERSGEPVQRFS